MRDDSARAGAPAVDEIRAKILIVASQLRVESGAAARDRKGKRMLAAVVTAPAGFLADEAKVGFPSSWIHCFPRACERERIICSMLGARPAMVARCGGSVQVKL